MWGQTDQLGSVTTTSGQRRLDCVIIGHNDIDFSLFADGQKAFGERSAGYSECVTNSVEIEGRRYTYIELLNRLLDHARGGRHTLNTFDVPSLAVAYLVSFLRKRELSAEGVNFFNAEKGRLVELLGQRPLCVAITTTYYVDDEPIREIIAFIRRHDPNTRIIVGGPRVLSLSLSQTDRLRTLVFKSIDADVFVESSQGEATLAKIVEGLKTDANLSAIPNVTLRMEDGRFKRGPRMEESNSLEENVIDWTRFPARLFTPINYMRTARSCPFACEFCNYPALAGEHTYLSISAIERELCVMKEAGVRNVIFIDDTFNVPFPRFKDICRMMIRNRFEFRWVSFFRCSSCDDEALDLMKESGCLGVYLGIESGDEEILRKMRKFANIERYCESIGKMNDRGILSLASMIIGFPGETAESVQRSIDFLNAAKPTFYNVQVYYHDKQAPIEKRREEFSISGSGYSWSHATMDWRTAVSLKEKMLRDVKGPLQLPLYGFSIWTVPYLLENGLSLDLILEFTKFANHVSRAELDGRPVDIHSGIARLINQPGWRQPLADPLTIGNKS